MFDPPALWFTAAAILGTAVFALKIAMLLLGATDLGADLPDADFDTGGLDADTGGLDADAPHHGGGHGAVHVLLELLSVQTFAAFAMGGGWVGLASLVTFGWGIWFSSLLGVAGGVGTVWLFTKLMRAAYRLQQSGNIPLDSALGLSGPVRVLVPASRAGSGRLALVVENRQREYDAVTDDESPIESGATARVLDTSGAHTLVITRS